MINNKRKIFLYNFIYFSTLFSKTNECTFEIKIYSLVIN